MKHSPGSNWLVTCPKFWMLILQVWLWCYYEISCEENGDNYFESVCLMNFFVVKSIQVDLKQQEILEIESLSWMLVVMMIALISESWDGLLLGSMCGLANILLELRKSSTRDFDSFESLNDDVIFHVVDWFGFYLDAKWSFISWFAKAKIHTGDLLFCLYKSFWMLWSHMLKWWFWYLLTLSNMTDWRLYLRLITWDC